MRPMDKCTRPRVADQSTNDREAFQALPLERTCSARMGPGLALSSTRSSRAVTHCTAVASSTVGIVLQIGAGPSLTATKGSTGGTHSRSGLPETV
jgi:hypothetical protein